LLGLELLQASVADCFEVAVGHCGHFLFVNKCLNVVIVSRVLALSCSWNFWEALRFAPLSLTLHMIVPEEFNLLFYREQTSIYDFFHDHEGSSFPLLGLYVPGCLGPR
jgi:hypothetical protein